MRGRVKQMENLRSELIETVKVIIIDNGYNVEVKKVYKNGIAKTGVMFIENETLSPCLYMEDFNVDNSTAESIANRIISAYERLEKTEVKSIDIIELLKDDVFILNHTYIGLQYNSMENIVKRKYDNFSDLEAYLYVRLNEEMTTKVTYNLIDLLNKSNGINEHLLWSFAESNTFREIVIEDLNEYIEKMTGKIIPKEDRLPLYIWSNEAKNKGASSVLCVEKLKDFAKKLNANRLVVVPSSIHECIVVPFYDGLDLQMLCDLINEVNNNEVKPEEVLSNHPYVIEF